MASIKELVAEKYDRVSLATEADNAAILAFLPSVAMDTDALQLRYQRDPDFFALLRAQGLPFVVFLFHNDDGSIGGMSVITSRDCLLQGRRTTICYAGDLRISPKISRRARLQWRKIYRDIAAGYRFFAELNYPEYMFTVIMDGNKDAIRAFLKPTANPVYRQLVDFQSVNILAQLWQAGCRRRYRASEKQNGYRFSWASDADLPNIQIFLEQENKGKKLGHNFSASGNDELLRRFTQWPDFSIASFLLLKDKTGEIIATMAPWSNGNARRIVVEKAPLPLRLLGRCLPLFGRRAIKENHELKILYLTCLEINKAKDVTEQQHILALMLDFLAVDRRCRQYNLLSFIDNFHKPLAIGLAKKGYLLTTKKAALYQVLSPEEAKEQRFLTVDEDELPGFELATA